ncbi:MAG: thioredoxin family protein [Nitrospirae bacterium]|nr:thioredoxin family protein [Nitrospirota bacterium]
MFKRIFSIILFLYLLFGTISVSKAEGPTDLPWMEYYEGLQKAQKENKPVFIYFYRIGCPQCKILNEEILTDETIKKTLKENFILIQIDGEGGKKQRDAAGKIVTERQLSKDYGVAAYPLVWFLQPDAKQIYKLTGVFAVKDYLQFINYVGNGWYKKMDMRQYFSEKPEGVYRE